MSVDIAAQHIQYIDDEELNISTYGNNKQCFLKNFKQCIKRAVAKKTELAYCFAIPQSINFVSLSL